MDEQFAELLSVDDVAKRLSVSRSIVYALVKSGDIPAIRIGIGRGTIRVLPIDLDAYVERCRVAVKKNEERPARRRRQPLKHIKL